MNAITEIQRELSRIEEKAGEGTAAASTLKERLDAMESKMDQQLNDLEAEMARPRGAIGAKGEIITREQKEHNDLFLKWLRQPGSAQAAAELDAKSRELKTASTGDPASYGHAVPEMIARDILVRARRLSPIRSIARVSAVGTADFKMLLSNNDAQSGWAGELDTRNETGPGTVEERSPTFGTVYALPSCSEELLDDAYFDLGGFIIDQVARDIAREEGAAFLSGNGSKKPTGIFNTAPEAASDEDDPARDLAALRYIPTGNAGDFLGLDTGAGISPGDTFLSTVYDLKAEYRQSAVWLMNSATAGVVRKFKDADGRYLWADGLSEGQPAILCGYRVVIDEAMPDIAADAHPILFGDFYRGYGIFDRLGMRITIDNNITTPGVVRWYMRRRVGGCVLDNNAIRAIKIAVS
ncbi:MAG: phage major capsid protein [Pseudomonadota bacterium]